MPFRWFFIGRKHRMIAGGSKGTVNKVILQDWEFVGGGKNNEEKAEEKKSQPKATYQEHYCTDDDDLPL